MNTQKTSILICIVVAVAAFALGWLLKGTTSDTSASPTPTPTATISVTPWPTWTASPTVTATRAPQISTVRLSAVVSPSSVTVSVGDVVLFVNDGPATYWPVSDTCPTLNADRALQVGERYQLNFTTPGTCTFHNQLDSANTPQTGTITIR